MRPRPVRRVPPSTVIREEIDQLLMGGVGPRNNIISTLADLGLRYIAQHGLEQEQEDFLGRAHYERRADRAPRGYRNGYEDASIKTAEGEAAVRVPQVRDRDEPYRSKLMGFLDGNSDVLERLVVEMYARGLSTRASRTAFGMPPEPCCLARVSGTSREGNSCSGASLGLLGVLFNSVRT
jgi:hypothetical protein